MPLTVEDGTGVAGANSYVTVVELRAFADARGLSLPSADTDVEPLAVRATDWLETYRARYRGGKTDPDQALQWPRYGVAFEGKAIDPDEIPELLKQAQCQAAVDVQANELTASPKPGIKREKVAVLEVEYFEGSADTAVNGSAKAEELIAPLLRTSSGGLRTVRV